MPPTLTTLRTEIRNRLADTATLFTNDVVDQAVRDALRLFNTADPRELVGTVTLASGGREVALSGLTQPATVRRIWCPYTAASPESPPEWRQFEQWTETLAYIREGKTPAAGAVARVFYTTHHTINGLDAASTTTFTEADTATIVEGACALAVHSRARAIAESINLNPTATESLIALANHWRAKFDDELTRRRALPQTP